MKYRFITILLLVCVAFSVQAQITPEAKLKYNMLKSNVKTKSFDDGLANLKWCLENSPKISFGVYDLGGRLINYVLKSGSEAQKNTVKTLGVDLYNKRFVNYPDKYLAKGHSDYGDFLKKIGQEESQYIDEYEKAFQLNPAKLGVGSIITYFTYVVDQNKENNKQLIFDTYDTTIEAINTKLENYAKTIEELEAKQEAGQTLLSKEKRILKSTKQNSKALGSIESVFDKKVEELSTCDYLIPLYSGQFEANKNDKKWLTRSINRMFKKKCTNDAFYAKLAEQYQEVAKSPDAIVFYAGVLMDKGETNKAISYFDKAIEQQTDPKEKSKLLYKVAKIYKNRNQTEKAVAYAKKSVSVSKNNGRAYLMIARAYAASANRCGKSEFEKRMAYVAAKKYASNAAKYDASVASNANSLIKNYEANQPNKKLIFNNELGLKSGDTYTVKCWFTETVKVP